MIFLMMNNIYCVEVDDEDIDNTVLCFGSDIDDETKWHFEMPQFGDKPFRPYEEIIYNIIMNA